MRRLQRGENVGLVFPIVRERAVLLTTACLGEEQSKVGNVEQGEGLHFHNSDKKTGRGVEVKIHLRQAGERRYSATVTTTFAGTTCVGNGKEKVR